MAVAFVSVLLFVVFQMCTCANFKMPPPFLENAQGKLCLHDDSLYKPWERFVNQRCTGYCTCNGRSGSVACVSLCPPSPIPMCAQGQVPEIRNEPTAVDPTGRCKCKRQSCRPRPNFPPLPPPVTRPECRNRAPDEWFLNKSCTGRCRCRWGGIACVSLCPLMVVECSQTSERESYEQSMDDEGRCFCKAERCVEKVGV
ncbi:uncharacterized protein LOC144654589 [Oculina patagonica]